MPNPIMVTQKQLLTTLTPYPNFTAFKREVGLDGAKQAVDDAYAEALRLINKATGFWNYGIAPSAATTTTLKFQGPDDVKTFIKVLELFFELDLKKIRDRRAYVNGVKGKAELGLLEKQLRNAFQNERSYYNPGIHKTVPNAPAIPDKSGAALELSKGLAWLTFGVQGDKAVYSQQLFKLKKNDGSFPLGANSTLLFDVWKALVPHAPLYRGWNNTASMQKYPSNVGGLKVLGEVITDLKTTVRMPPRGDDGWYDLALYVFAAIMALQGFTDGNKRMARFAYVLMLLSGSVPMIVPGDVLGGQLADML